MGPRNHGKNPRNHGVFPLDLLFLGNFKIGIRMDPMIKFTIPCSCFFDLDIGHFSVNVDRYIIYLYIYRISSGAQLIITGDVK